MKKRGDRSYTSGGTGARAPRVTRRPSPLPLGYEASGSGLRRLGRSPSCSYGDQETAGDVIALIEELGGPAVVMGNSMGAGSALLAAAQRPEMVSGLALAGPFVRDPAVSTLRRVLLRSALLVPRLIEKRSLVTVRPRALILSGAGKRAGGRLTRNSVVTVRLRILSAGHRIPGRCAVRGGDRLRVAVLSAVA